MFDPLRGRVVKGYGILQPRVGVALPSAHRSRFAAVHSGHPGVDPYTTAVSDVYQDLFGEGSFTGKGIYDVAAFRPATRGRFPENTLLSHDLIEGNYARAGARHRHRGLRRLPGALPQLSPGASTAGSGATGSFCPGSAARVPGPDGPEPNRLSLLSRWKILDNLRRSLVEPAWLLFFLAGWLVLPGDPLRWTLLAIGAMAATHVVALLLVVLRPPQGKSLRAWYAPVGGDAATSMQQLALAIAFLPHQAWISVDAIVRTLWRLVVSRRKLLEWRTASQTERMVAGGGHTTWRTMWPAVALGVGPLAASAGWLLIRGGAHALDPLRRRGAAGGRSLALRAPGSRARSARRPRGSSAGCRVGAARPAMRYALLHWCFFDRFVGAATHWLAPDNFQADPEPVVAMRTSPTNVSLQLLATVSAWDLGFLTLADMVERLERTFDTLRRLRRYRGHFYNWYDLTTLEVLEPAYVSTVDSGNLAGHFVALRQAVPRDAGSAGVRRAGAAGAGSGADAGPGACGEGRRGHRARPRGAGRARGGRPDASRRDADRGGPAARSSGVGMAQLVPTLAQRHAAEIEGVALRGVRRRENEGGAHSETWGELAARSPAAADALARLGALAEQCAEIVAEMDFGFLYDRTRSLFAIGYRSGSPTLDPSYYDLLASEARLASFMAVARGRGAGGALVPPRPHPHPRRWRDGAGVVERKHVRVPDAGAGDALLPRHACSTRPATAPCGGRSRTPRGTGCRGA